jgi:Ni/Co efflux regulator RcnB
MRNLIVGISAAALIAGAAGAVNAQPGYYGYQQQTDYQHNSNSDRHAGWSHDQGADHRWNHGDRMGYNDWSSAQPVDYRAHHLRRPPHGYEWRESNGQFILAAVATGVIASIILDHAR